MRKKKEIRPIKQRGRNVVIASLSIRPELKLRCMREIGGGNFSRGVGIAIEYMLQHIDEGRFD